MESQAHRNMTVAVYVADIQVVINGFLVSSMNRLIHVVNLIPRHSKKLEGAPGRLVETSKVIDR